MRFIAAFLFLLSAVPGLLVSSVVIKIAELRVYMDENTKQFDGAVITVDNVMRTRPPSFPDTHNVVVDLKGEEPSARIRMLAPIKDDITAIAEPPYPKGETDIDVPPELSVEDYPQLGQRGTSYYDEFYRLSLVRLESYFQSFSIVGTLNINITYELWDQSETKLLQVPADRIIWEPGVGFIANLTLSERYLFFLE